MTRRPLSARPYTVVLSAMRVDPTLGAIAAVQAGGHQNNVLTNVGST